MRLPVVARYALIQLPELVLVGGVLAWLASAQWLGPVTAASLFGLWVLKEVAFYPLYRHALRDTPVHGMASLVGARGVVDTELAPVGQVRVGGERWRARCGDGTRLTPGARVRVTGFKGLTLEVVDDDRA